MNRLYAKPQTPRIYHRGGAPSPWFLMQAPGSPFANDTGDVGDITGNNPAGVRTAGCTWVSGPRGNCLSFNGAGYVELGNSARIQLANLSAFIRVNTSGSGSGFHAICAKNQAYSLFLLSDVLGCFDWGTTSFQSTGINLADGKWHDVGMVVAGGVLTIWCDGIAYGGLMSSPIDQTSDLFLGSNAGVQIYTGLLDDFRLYNYALTPAQVARDFADPFWRLRAPRRDFAIVTPVIPFPFGDPLPANPRITPVQMMPY